MYDLYGVVNHFGILGAGHYVSYAINKHDGKWHCFNDSRVTDLDDTQVQSPSAYLLFYARRDLADATLRTVFPRVNRTPIDVSKIGRPTWRERWGDMDVLDKCNIM